ncbi:septum formation protein [Eubacterium uniforme]|uniref:dTTP/UTP pyrophosphatase n=2 Tax=Eubacterium uniforme TaxID=39495 RepID=A0A1T4VKA9_9FIRM|nr:septum formation protein [Eubacterium uniforme]
MRVVLASASPRRKELLGNIYSEFEVIPSTVEENIEFTNVEEYVKELAFIKAMDVVEMIKSTANANASEENELLVIGADTIVYNDGKVLGKPKDEEDATKMIRSLAGKKHQVYTGVCLISNVDEEVDSASRIGDLLIQKFYSKTDVYVDDITDKEIADYVATGDPLDKAGSYGIQGVFSKHIRKIDGDYFNVVGLPVNEIYRHLDGLLNWK